MKEFIEVTFDPVQSRIELDELGALLNSSANLSESKHLHPFFRARRQLTAFLGTFVSEIGPARRLAHEFPIFGDFATDIVVGNQDRGNYCLIELEDATSDSI